MNEAFIIGNLTKDPDNRITQGGVNVCSFTVAVNRRRVQGQEQEPDYFRVTTWRELAESCGKYLSKGNKVAVNGSISLSVFKAQDGSPRANIELNAKNVEFLTPPKQEQQTENKPNAVKNYVEVTDEELPWG